MSENGRWAATWHGKNAHWVEGNGPAACGLKATPPGVGWLPAKDEPHCRRCQAHYDAEVEV